jgi:hypothetical protein
MGRADRRRVAIRGGFLGVALIVAAGCGTVSGSTAPGEARDASADASAPAESPAAPATPPAPTPPPSLREAGAQIADEAALKELIQGKTTKAEVRERFGVPQEIVLSPGYETFVYYRERTSGLISKTTERIEMLTVRFDPQGILKDFEYRFSGQ